MGLQEPVMVKECETREEARKYKRMLALDDLNSETKETKNGFGVFVSKVWLDAAIVIIESREDSFDRY